MDGLGASPPVFAALPKPKLGVEDAPAVAPPPPNRPPGLLAAGVLDAPPPNRPAPPELAPPPPNSPELGVLDPVFAVPKRDGDELPVVLPAPPNSPPAGFGVFEAALLPLGCPNVKPDMTAVGRVFAQSVSRGVLPDVGGCCRQLFTKVESCAGCAIDAASVSRSAKLRGLERAKSSEGNESLRKCFVSLTGASMSQPKSWADSCMGHAPFLPGDTLIQLELQRSGALIPRAFETQRRLITCIRVRRSTLYYLRIALDFISSLLPASYNSTYCALKHIPHYLHTSSVLEAITTNFNMADELAPPRKSVELEDPGAKELGTSRSIT